MLYVVYARRTRGSPSPRSSSSRSCSACFATRGRKLAVLGVRLAARVRAVIGSVTRPPGRRARSRSDALQLGVVHDIAVVRADRQHVKRLQRGLTEASLKLEDSEERARRDDLTGVYNRRALLVAMEEASGCADVANEPLSICMIDLDRSSAERRFDHLTGDQVLRTFAETVQGGLRATDGRTLRRRGIRAGCSGTHGGARWPTPSGCANASAQLDMPGHALDRPADRDRPGAVQARRIDHRHSPARRGLYRAMQHGRNRVGCAGAAAAQSRSKLRRRWRQHDARSRCGDPTAAARRQAPSLRLQDRVDLRRDWPCPWSRPSPCRPAIERLLLAGPVLGDDRRVGGDHVVDDRLDRARVGDLLQPALRDDRVGIAASRPPTSRRTRPWRSCRRSCRRRCAAAARRAPRRAPARAAMSRSRPVERRGELAQHPVRGQLAVALAVPRAPCAPASK